MPEWLHKYLISQLRGLFYKTKLRSTALKLARISRGLYRCAECREPFSYSEVHVDHIDPVIDSTVGWVDWNTYLSRLFTDKLQVLCTACHQEKTNQENATRRQTYRKPVAD